MISGLPVCCSQNVTVSFLPAFTGILYEKFEAISEGGPGAGVSQGVGEENQHQSKQFLSGQPTQPGHHPRLLLLFLLLLQLQLQIKLQLRRETDRKQTTSHSTLYTVAGSYSGVA